MRHLALAAVLTLAPLLAGCMQPQTAPPAYKFSNISRLNAVGPWLSEYATDLPDKAVRVNDVLKSWQIEVDAQQGRTPTTLPSQ